MESIGFIGVPTMSCTSDRIRVSLPRFKIAVNGDLPSIVPNNTSLDITLTNQSGTKALRKFTAVITKVLEYTYHEETDIVDLDFNYREGGTDVNFNSVTRVQPVISHILQHKHHIMLVFEGDREAALAEINKNYQIFTHGDQIYYKQELNDITTILDQFIAADSSRVRICNILIATSLNPSSKEEDDEFKTMCEEFLRRIYKED